MFCIQNMQIVHMYIKFKYENAVFKKNTDVFLIHPYFFDNVSIRKNKSVCGRGIVTLFLSVYLVTISAWI